MSQTKNAAKGRINATRRKEIGRERRERTRAKLLTAAARVLAEHGDKKTTIDDFIQAAGVARGTFYNYFQTREQILNELWAEVGREPFIELQEACAGIEDPAERLITKIRLVLKMAGAHNAWGWVVFASSLDITTVNADLLAFPRPDLQEGRDKARFRFDDIEAAKDLVVGATRAALRARLNQRRSAKYCAEIAVLTLRALGISAKDARNLARKPLPELPVGRSARPNGQTPPMLPADKPLRPALQAEARSTAPLSD